MTYETEPTLQSADEHVAPGVRLPSNALDFNFVRSSGPGGQNVNKLNTKAQLTVLFKDLRPHLPDAVLKRLKSIAGSQFHENPDRLVLESQESRSQRGNRQDTLDKLRELIVRAKAKPKRRKKTRPPRRVKEQRLKSKKRRGEIKRLRNKPTRDARR
jgi:ribosome-associated protein